MNEDNFLLVALGRIAHWVRYSTDEEISKETREEILDIAEEAIDKYMDENKK